VLGGVGLTLFFMLSPLVLFGTDAIVAVHDNLDSPIFEAQNEHHR
jgi:hypothetical protein